MGESTKVMVIDDSSLVLSVVRSFLESAGHEVVTRTEALGTRAAVLRERPDVVLLDVGMPMLDGDEICASIRAHPTMRNACVLLYSSRSEDELREVAERAGADGYLCKTDDRRTFLAAFERMRHRMRGRPRAFQGQYVLAACGGELHPRLRHELVLASPLRLTSSGVEALRHLVSRDPPRLLLLGSRLDDMSWDALWS